MRQIDTELNKTRFLDLVNSITRPGLDKEKLLYQLENSDFFTAPASTRYHNSMVGGLCDHSLNVYDILVNLVDMFNTSDVVLPYEQDSLKIVALFHDFDKMNKYQRTAFNSKEYSPTGSKEDEVGKFDWVSTLGWKIKDSADTFTIGTHGENSVFMTECFMPLTAEEHAAIVNHHSVYDNPKNDITGIYNKYSLACLLHTADMLSTYVVEKV